MLHLHPLLLPFLLPPSSFFLLSLPSFLNIQDIPLIVSAQGKDVGSHVLSHKHLPHPPWPQLMGPEVNSRTKNNQTAGWSAAEYFLSLQFKLRNMGKSVPSLVGAKTEKKKKRTKKCINVEWGQSVLKPRANHIVKRKKKL